MPLAELDGLTLHYKEHGSGPPVLGIMGFGLDQRFWASQLYPMSQRNRFIVFDNRGTGRSSRHAASSIDEMADDAVRLLDHLGIERTVVFGVSMGGAIAQRLALDHPDRIEALILAVTWARPIEFMRRQHVVARLIVESGGSNALVDTALMWMFTPRFFEAGRDVIDRLVAAVFAETGPEAAAGDVLLAQLDAIDKHDTLEQLRTIDRPTLVLGGKSDMMVPGFASEEIAAAIPGAELEMFETGHACMIEEMEPFNARVRAFLDSVASR